MDFRGSSGGTPLYRQADRIAAELCRTGGYRYGERAAVDRDPRSGGAADRDCRGLAGHQLFARASSGGALEGASSCLAANPKSPELPFGEFIHLLRQWVCARISALAVLTLSRLAAAHHDVVQVQA